MNKKFSTLLAAFLAAGALTTANAQTDLALSSLAGSEPVGYVLGQGKYYLLHRTQFRAVSATGWTNDANYYFTFTNAADPQLVFSNRSDLRDKSAYWTLKDVTAPGEQMIGNATKVVQLVNAEGYTLTIDATTHKMATSDTKKEDQITRFYLDRNGNDKAILAYAVNGAKYVLGNSAAALSAGVYEVEGIANIGATSGTFNDFTVEEIAEELISAADLNKQLGSGFALSFQSKGEGYENLQGNVFTGNLKAIAITGSSSYYLQRADGQYIVLTDNVWSETTANLDGKKASAFRGYKFDAVSKHTFDNLANKQLAQFQIFKSYDFNNTDSLIVTLPNVGVLSTDLATNSPVKVFVSNVDSKNYVTVVEASKANDKLAAVNNDGYANTQVGAVAPYIKYGSENIVTAEDFRGKAWNIRKKDGSVLSPASQALDNHNYEFIPAEQVDLAMPEGQWLPTSTGFVNRESGREYDMFSWYTVRKIATDVYRCSYTWNGQTYSSDVIITEAEDAELGKTEKGYASFDMAVEALNGKYITLTDAVSGNTIYVAKDADDNVFLSSDKSQAIEFRVKEITHDYTSHDGLAGVDTLQHYTSYLGYDKKGNKIDCKDTVQFAHYMLYEHFSEKYLTYDRTAKKYVMTPLSRTENKHEDFSTATSFVIKVKGDGTYNLIRDYKPIYPVCDVTNGVHTPGTIVSTGDGYSPKFDNDFEANIVNAHKVYGAFQTATLADMQHVYNFNDNDRFALEAVATPEYQTITTSQDTVVISRYGNPNIVMFEQNKDGINFLAMEHVADVEKMAPAMLADTAYVRNNTFKPQYLLGVATDIRVEEFCSRPDLHAALHKDTVYGRFLVNLVDSVTAKNVKTYTWDKTNFYKLGFVEGFHTDDYLYIVNNGKVSNKIFLGDNKDKVCTFAFRYVDEAREAIKIETAYSTADVWGNRTRGWIKWHNGVPVVINDYDQADLFVVDATTEEAPTANEAVAAEVSVVAAQGAIIVKGAAGKVVTVANILGQTIANQVAASDNVTIAAPAGVAVVTVDGEATKVVVK